MRAKKSFGQHFLKSESIASSISNSLPIDEGITRVLEVGPGKGMLTKYLHKNVEELKVVELDRDMIPILLSQFPEMDIIQEDFLKLDLSQVFEGQKFYLIGNYPYNISSQIVFKMIDYRDLIPCMVGMFQKEVADRIVSEPGSKKYGIISVLTQLYFDGTLLFDVDRTEFSPPPKVQSAVIKLQRRKTEYDVKDHVLFKNWSNKVLVSEGK